MPGSGPGPTLLAAYGTLMTGQENGLPPAMRARLLGGRPCLIRGRLYEVREAMPGGREAVYPALVEGRHDRARIPGEVFEIGGDPAEAAATLAAIDRYEDCIPDDPTASTYLRRRRPVLASGLALEAWIYLYNRPVDRLRPVPGNSWAGPA